MGETSREEFFAAARTRLQQLWEQGASTDTGLGAAGGGGTIPPVISEAIHRSINAATMAFRYVLPTQLLGKLIDPALHARSSQAGSGLAGAWDARSLCHTVITEFDEAHDRVLGGSPAPYLSKPLRERSISKEYLQSKRQKSEYQDLIRVLDFAERNPEKVEEMYRDVLRAIRARLDVTALTYPVPNRVSAASCHGVILAYVSEPAGGARLQAVSVALFRAVGERLQLFHGVRSANINAADVRTGHVADLECIHADGTIVFAVEVKDRHLVLRDIQDKLPSIRQRGVKDAIFLTRGGVRRADQQSVDGIVLQQFGAGHNLYIAEFDPFLQTCLVLLAEVGRRDFLQAVGAVLDENRVGLVHRQRWRELLQDL